MTDILKRSDGQKCEIFANRSVHRTTQIGMVNMPSQPLEWTKRQIKLHSDVSNLHGVDRCPNPNMKRCNFSLRFFGADDVDDDDGHGNVCFTFIYVLFVCVSVHFHVSVDWATCLDSVWCPRCRAPNQIIFSVVVVIDVVKMPLSVHSTCIPFCYVFCRNHSSTAEEEKESHHNKWIKREKRKKWNAFLRFLHFFVVFREWHHHSVRLDVCPSISLSAFLLCRSVCLGILLLIMSLFEEVFR